MQRPSSVLITGITGYLGSHICKAVLKDPAFRIRGSSRNINNPYKIQLLQKAFDDDLKQIELVQMDLLDSQSINEAVKGVDYIIHSASPYPSKLPDDPNVLIKPAVEGTLSVLEAAQRHKVKKVVMTSSVAAIANVKPQDTPSIYNESHWSDENLGTAYTMSKTRSEKAAWDYFNSLPKDNRFKFVVLNPSMLLGPHCASADFTSGIIVKHMMTTGLKLMPYMMFGLVDVRDVANAHLQALKIDSADNQRFIISAQGFWMRQIAELLKKEYGKHYKISTKESNYYELWLSSYFDPTIKNWILPRWGREINYDNSKSKKLLNINYKDPKESLIEMTEALIKDNIIPDLRKK